MKDIPVKGGITLASLRDVAVFFKNRQQARQLMLTSVGKILCSKNAERTCARSD